MLRARDTAEGKHVTLDALVVFAFSGLLGVSGAIAATSFPADDASVTGDPLSGFDLSSPLTIVNETWAATVSALVATGGVLPLTSLDMWVILLFLVAGSVAVIVLLTVVVIAAIAFSKDRLTLTASLASLAVTFAFLVVLKDPIIVRYQALWALPAIVVVWIIATRSTPGRVLSV